MGSCHSDSVKQLPTFITEIVSDHCTVLPCTLVSAVPWVSGKEVAVVVLRPGGHVTAAASWWREAAEPPPCRRLDQCVLTQCQAAGAQAMYSPMTQEFATLQDLASNYRLFVNRVEQQLYTIGGGGAAFIHDLDDVDFDRTTGTNKLLIYDGTQWVGIASTALGGSTGVGGTDFISGIAATFSSKVTTDFLAGIAATFSGNVTVGGTITYQDVTHQDVLGISTFQQGIQILNNGLSVNTGIVTVVPPSGIGTVRIGAGDTTLYVDGDARIVGILTIGRSSVTIDGTTNKITVGDEDVIILSLIHI